MGDRPNNFISFQEGLYLSVVFFPDLVISWSLIVMMSKQTHQASFQTNL